MTSDEMRESLKWFTAQRRYSQAEVDAAVAAERERWVNICRVVMAEHGGDPTGQFVSSDPAAARQQCFAAGASVVLHRAKIA